MTDHEVLESEKHKLDSVVHQHERFVMLLFKFNDLLMTLDFYPKDH
jgi:hypothetical protein